ncbi:MAG: SRPBCC family protein [bacterium]|nr:SRPBCC family protein [bacterium]
MSVWSETILIDAPIDLVFETISSPEKFMEAVPQITSIEFLSEQRSGPGTQFKETRVMGKRKASTVLKVVDQERNSHIRMISNAGGTSWDSTFSTKAEKDGVQLRFVMTAVPSNFLARMSVRMIKGMISKALRNDMLAVKEYCETQKK